MKQPKSGLRLITLLAVALMLAAGCASSPPTAQQERLARAPEGAEPARALSAFAYDCDDGLAIVTEFEGPETLYLFLPAQNLELQRVRSGSGARFRGEDDTEFWTKGDEARLSLPGGGTLVCTEDRRRSIIEDARLRGVDFWAAGNEPAWTLEIDAERTLLVTDYGKRRAWFPTTTPAVDPAVGSHRYRMSTEAHDIRIVLSDKPCKDSLDGSRFEKTVRVVFDGEILSGCGLALH